MTITISALLWLLLTHWWGDFVLQTDWQAKNKSSNFRALLSHVLIYTSFITVSNLANLGFHWFNFWTITFTTHLVIDAITSRLTSKLWKAGNSHDFFVVVGFDQFLHATQLILTYLLVTHV